MAYSVDLRKCIVAGVLEQGLSIGEAAKVFQVGSATVERYLRWFTAYCRNIDVSIEGV